VATFDCVIDANATVLPIFCVPFLSNQASAPTKIAKKVFWARNRASRTSGTPVSWARTTRGWRNSRSPPCQGGARWCRGQGFPSHVRPLNVLDASQESAFCAHDHIAHALRYLGSHIDRGLGCKGAVWNRAGASASARFPIGGAHCAGAGSSSVRQQLDGPRRRNTRIWTGNVPRNRDQPACSGIGALAHLGWPGA
jgi:hypothetical protein